MPDEWVTVDRARSRWWFVWWAAGFGGWVAAMLVARDHFGPRGLDAVHAAGVAGFGLWLCWRASSGRPVLGGHPTFGGWGGLLSLVEAGTSAMRAVDHPVPLWWIAVKGALVLYLAIVELRFAIGGFLATRRDLRRYEPSA